jgi:hypothetical protein
MILIGGFNLWMDSCVNIIINSKFLWSDYGDQQTGICALSILTTLTFHYFGYFCLIFRSQRIFKVMKLTQKYINRIYKLSQDVDQDSVLNDGEKPIITMTGQQTSILESMSSPMILDEDKRQLTASQFEHRMLKSEKKKEEQLYACRE